VLSHIMDDFALPATIGWPTTASATH
jgi:hypothetical protein